MQSIHIDNVEIEKFIQTQYGDDKASLVNDFISFIKTELLVNDIKKGFDEVAQYKNDNAELTDAKDFLSELKSGH
ncbi:hypothetical protein JHD50_13260 [Sulfurimonas sp. MAG313]|nr:hypothetical protein [Sulfurimonas sp. MAG313]MDF1882257.1 hypothetical protein [Sulfurimonas sp. MAG313]